MRIENKGNTKIFISPITETKDGDETIQQASGTITTVKPQSKIELGLAAEPGKMQLWNIDVPDSEGAEVIYEFK